MYFSYTLMNYLKSFLSQVLTSSYEATGLPSCSSHHFSLVALLSYGRESHFNVLYLGFSTCLLAIWARHMDGKLHVFEYLARQTKNCGTETSVLKGIFEMNDCKSWLNFSHRKSLWTTENRRGEEILLYSTLLRFMDLRF